MKRYSPHFILSISLIALSSLSPAWAQTQGEQPQQPAATEAEQQQLVITAKEVAAVQAELQRRGYFRTTPHGVLDADTREAIVTYRKEHNLGDSGRIDKPLLDSLELQYPATGKEVESARKKGFLPRVGYGVKDTATGARDATVNAGKSVKKGTERAYDATTNTMKNAADTTKDKSKDLAKDAGDVTVKGAKKVGNATSNAARKTSDATVRTGRRVSDAIVGRSDADIQRDVRDELEKDEATAHVRTEVKDGAVRIFVKEDIDVSNAVSRIRQVSGVRTVVVVAK